MEFETFTLTDCPKKHIDLPTLELHQMVRLAETHLPLTGGVLDQTKSFIDAWDWIRNEKKRWENECLRNS